MNARILNARTPNSRTPLTLTLLLTAVVATPRASAQDTRPARPFTEYAKGTWTTQAYGGYLNELGPHDQEMVFGSFGASYYFVDNMSLGAELLGYFVSQPGPESFMAGPQGIFRHHLFNDRDTSLFLDITIGFVQGTERVPQDGTYFNFIEQAGLGVARRLEGNSHLLLGVRYYHLSNAQIEGDDHNPSNNGVCAYVGVLFTL